MNSPFVTDSLNSSLLYLLLQRAKAFVVVDASGNGDYSTIEAALASSARMIFVKAGTYTPAADLNITGKWLIGEHPEHTIINLGNYEIYCAEETAEYAAAGTPVLNHGAVVVGGTGTNYSTVNNTPAHATFDDLIFSIISSITNDTTAALSHLFEGPVTNHVGGSIPSAFKMQYNKNVNVKFANFTINHLPTVAGKSTIKLIGSFNQLSRITVNASQANVSQCVLVGPDTSSLTYGTLIEGCTFRGGIAGVAFFNAYYSRIVDSEIAFGSTYGFYCSSGRFLTLDNCRVHSTVSGMYSLAGFSSISVRNSFFSYCTYGIRTHLSTLGFLSVTDSFFKYISTWAVNPGSSHNRITGCHFDWCDKSILGKIEYSVVSGNTFSAFDCGVHLESGSNNVAISGNSFYGTDTAGNSYNAIYGTGSVDCSITGNTFYDFDNFIYLTNCQSFTISSNSFRGGIENGIYLNDTCSGISIVGNSFNHMASDGSTHSIDTSADYCSIIGNTFRTCDTAIEMSGDKNEIIGDTFSSCTTNLHDTGADNDCAHCTT